MTTQKGFAAVSQVFVVLLILLILLPELHDTASAFDSGGKSDPARQGPGAPYFLETSHLWLVPASTIQFSLAANRRPQWQAPLSGLEGALWRFAILRIDFEIATNVSVQIRGALQQQLDIDATASDPIEGMPFSGTTRDVGDFSVATLLRIVHDARRQIAFGFRIETTLPNTTQSKGIGPNTTDIYLSALLSKKIGRTLLFGDLGIGILTAPAHLDEQNDVLAYGLGFSHPLNPRLQLGGEVNGYLTTRNLVPAGTEARGMAQLGISWQLGEYSIELAVLHGLTTNEGKSGWLIGFARRLKL